MMSPELMDFESGASTNFATPGMGGLQQRRFIITNALPGRSG